VRPVWTISECEITDRAKQQQGWLATILIKVAGGALQFRQRPRFKEIIKKRSRTIMHVFACVEIIRRISSIDR
jgi:hypothetical protein